MNVEHILCLAYPPPLAQALVGAYKEIEENFSLEKWKASELDAGHFVEAARRIVEHMVYGQYTPIGKTLPRFTEAELNKLANGAGDESFRILIPRVLWSVYGIRNKRGVGHIGSVSPNEMDSTLILYACKWVLGELIRIPEGIDPSVAARVVDEVIERRVPLLWKQGDVTHVLDTGLTTDEKILVLLFDSSPQSLEQLQSAVEYKHITRFKAFIAGLRKKQFLAGPGADGRIAISPTGRIEAERLVLRSKDPSTR